MSQCCMEGGSCAQARDALDEIAMLRAVLARIDAHWDGYSDGEWADEDAEGVELLAQVHFLVTGRPTCVCGHEQEAHDGGPLEDRDPAMPCQLCGCLVFSDALKPTVVAL